MLPFLKNRMEGSASGPVEIVKREPDEAPPGEDWDMLDAVASDLLEAFEKKDRTLLKEALAALCMHIAEADEKKDMEEP